MTFDDIVVAVSQYVVVVVKEMVLLSYCSLYESLEWLCVSMSTCYNTVLTISPVVYVAFK